MSKKKKGGTSKLADELPPPLNRPPPQVKPLQKHLWANFKVCLCVCVGGVPRGIQLCPKAQFSLHCSLLSAPLVQRSVAVLPGMSPAILPESILRVTTGAELTVARGPEGQSSCLFLVGTRGKEASRQANIDQKACYDGPSHTRQLSGATCTLPPPEMAIVENMAGS